MAKINARSPYYITISGGTFEFADMELWIYTGEKTVDRESGTFFQLRSTAIVNVSVFEIAEIVKDYISNTFSGNYQNENVWVDYSTSKTNNGVQTPPTSFISLRGFYGYGYFQDGANPQLDFDYLQTNKTILKWDGEPLRVPVDTETTTNISFYYNNSEVYSEAISSSNESDEQIKYILSDGAVDTSYQDRVLADGGTFEGSICLTEFQQQFGGVFDVDTVYIDGANGVTVVKVQNIEECKYEPYRLTFENKLGALQDLWFFKRADFKLTTKKENFKRNIIQNGVYGISNHQDKILTKNGVEKLSLNTGFYPELYNEIFKEINLSENVWIEIGNQILPVNLDSSGLDYKTQLNDKLINYTIDISFAFDTINNIR